MLLRKIKEKLKQLKNIKKRLLTDPDPVLIPLKV
jgi:hypothetical protein